MSNNLETPVTAMLEEGYDKFRLTAETRELLMVWMTKIMIGLATRGLTEYKNPADRNLNPDHGLTITNDVDYILSLDRPKALLAKRARNKAPLSDTEASSLGSIFIFKAKNGEDGFTSPFHFTHGHQTIPVLVLRYKDIGLIAFFEGGDAIEKWYGENFVPPSNDSHITRFLDLHGLQAAKRMALTDQQLDETAAILCQGAYMFLKKRLPTFWFTVAKTQKLVPTSKNLLVRDSFGFPEKNSLIPIYSKNMFMSLVLSGRELAVWQRHKSLLTTLIGRPRLMTYSYDGKTITPHFDDSSESLIVSRCASIAPLTLHVTRKMSCHKERPGKAFPHFVLFPDDSYQPDVWWSYEDVCMYESLSDETLPLDALPWRNWEPISLHSSYKLSPSVWHKFTQWGGYYQIEEVR
jgi:hypothetical protein